MVARKAWRLYVAHWPELLMTYVFAILLYGVVALVAGLTMVPLLGEAGADLSVSTIMPLLTSGALAGKLFLAAVLAGIVLLAVAPLAKGGLFDAVVRVQRHEAVSAGEFWQAGVRYWGRCLALTIVQMVIGLLLLLAWAGLARVNPILGTGLWLLLAAPILVVLVGCAQYVAIAEDRGAGAAISRASRILVSRPGDVLVTTLVLGGGTLLVGAAGGLLRVVPILGTVLHVALQLAWGPYGLLYLAVRYESRISPGLTRAGGVAAFHPNPPPGAGV